MEGLEIKKNQQDIKGHVLYLVDEIEKLDSQFIKNSIPRLSQERFTKAFAYRFPVDKALSVAAYLLLRHALIESCGIDEPVIFSYRENGKPFLRDYPRIHFNLSHCPRAVACAVSEAEIGVDVQEIRPVSEALAKRVLTAKEYAKFKACTDPARMFCEYWAIKESYLKYTGLGLRSELTELSADDIKEKKTFTENEAYICCVCGASEGIRCVMPSIACL